MNSEQAYHLRLSNLQAKAAGQIDSLHNNFNKIKDDMLTLNKEYERLNRQSLQPKCFQEEIIRAITEEIKETKAIIEERCIQLGVGLEQIGNEQGKLKENLSSEYSLIYNQITESLNALVQQIEMVRTGRDQTQLTLIDEMTSEFNHCFTLVWLYI